jgi:hypothetical protein
MAAVTLDMIYRLALEVRDLQASVLASTSETLDEVRAMNAIAMRADTRAVLALVDRRDACLTRIERRLGLVDAATA